MNEIPTQICARLKRLCPYTGPHIPESVRQRARDFWCNPLSNVERDAGWNWDGGSGHWQAELELSDLDDDRIDPVGYVAIRPLAHGKVIVTFMLSLSDTDQFKPPDLPFPSLASAKRYLDLLLAASTPEIPFPHT